VPANEGFEAMVAGKLPGSPATAFAFGEMRTMLEHAGLTPAGVTIRHFSRAQSPPRRAAPPNRLRYASNRRIPTFGPAIVVVAKPF